MNLKSRLFDIVIFLLTTVCLFITANLFMNMGIFVDEYNLSPDIVLGGEFWLNMDWLRLGFLFVIWVLSGINIFRTKTK
ncbi:hypothetical protein CHL78_004765 [Romboutsia weinsteinii]|uniref:Uncharacterized protein n=1 Tax=Romboutsia weinsteinii TaxID=2020949 RepID=A0A371J6U8_9FIRM|nr:hypothetical protein [Romboutsia weinsteinii]RDY28502.1 hypothetical protein CHL78_004765 [Romboutsia weinsteinii]